MAVIKQFLILLTDGVTSYKQGRMRCVSLWLCFLKKSICLLCICVSRDLREETLIKYDTRMLKLEVYFPIVKLVLGLTVHLLQDLSSAESSLKCATDFVEIRGGHVLKS